MTATEVSAARTRLGCYLGTLILCLVIRDGTIGAGRLDLFGRGLGFDFCLLSLEWLVFELVARAAPAPWGPSLLFYPLLAFELGLVFAHSWFFHVAIERQLTLLDLTVSGIEHYLITSLPPAGRWAFAASLLALLVVTVAARAIPLSPGTPRWLRLQATVGALVVAVMPWSLSAPRVASPLFDSANELYRLVTRPRLTPRTPGKLSRWYAELDATRSELQSTPGAQPRYDKVIVLVMETMTAEQLELERPFVPRASFVNAEQEHARSYERYFPDNQDSRTGMLDMLFSRLIPYEAYSEEGLAHYRLLARDHSLVDRMHALGYRSAFAVSQNALEEVVDELRWDESLNLGDPEIAKARASGALCFSPDEYESSCEDLVLLPKVLDFVASNERAFLYQEFIWGHAVVYNQASGRSNTAYYSEYVDALREGLRKRGLLERTLIAFTSDHGLRDKTRQPLLSSYRMPLWFHGVDVAPARVSGLFSHRDFASLLFEQLLPGTVRAPEHELVLIVGPTGQGHLFAVGRQGGELLAWHRAGRDYELARAGKLPLSEDELLGLFAHYRAEFDRHLSALPER